MNPYIGGTDPTASSLIYQFVQASSTITTSSTSYVTTGLSIVVLETGNYLILSNSYINNSSGVGLDREGNTNIFVNNSQLANNESGAGCVLSGVSLANNGFDGTTVNMAVQPLSAGDSVELRFRRVSGGGSIEMNSRAIVLIKVS